MYSIHLFLLFNAYRIHALPILKRENMNLKQLVHALENWMEKTKMMIVCKINEFLFIYVEVVRIWSSA